MEGELDLFQSDGAAGGLTETQAAAIDLLASGTSVSEAARELGVARETVSRWVNRDREFIAALNRVRKEMHRTHGDRLRRLATRAFEVVEESMGEDSPPQIRLKAALAVIEAAKAIEKDVGHTSKEVMEAETYAEVASAMLYLHMLIENFEDREALRRRAAGVMPGT